MFNPFRLITHNWIWKLLALGSAMMVFFSVRKATNYTQVLSIPIEAISADGEQALTGFDPAMVNVTFRGSEQAIRTLSFPGVDPPHIRLLIDQPPPGQSTLAIKLSHNNVGGISDLRVANISPDTITASFDVSATHSMPVAEPIIKGAPAAGSVKVTFSPKSVEVTGSALRLEDLEHRKMALSTAILDVSSRNEGFQTTLKVLPPDNKGIWTIKPDVVQVDVQFIREESTRMLADLPVQVLQSEESGTTYTPANKTVSITLQGARSDIDAIKPESILVLLKEPPKELRSAGMGFLSTPIVTLPYTNHVDKISVTPAEIILNPVKAKPETK